MKYIYELVANIDREADQLVLDYKLGEMKTYRLREGNPYTGNDLSNVQLYIDTKKNSKDYIENPLSWILVSSKLLHTLLRYVPNDFEYFDAPVFDITTKQSISDIFIVNIVRLIKSVNVEKSKVIYMDKTRTIAAITEYFFEKKQIPDESTIFRPAEFPASAFITEPLFSALKEQQLAGVGVISHKLF